MRSGAAAGEQLVDWLARRAEPAPESLQLRLRDAVRSANAVAAESLADVAVRAGERLLADVLAHGCAERTAAPALLAADALVTYAFEAAADDDTQSAAAVEASAARTAARIAAFGVGA